MSFITILIFSTTFIPENMLLNSTSSIFGSVKFDYVFIALTVTYLVDAITKFAFISDFPTILVQGIWTYNAVIIAIAMWFMIYSKDTLVNILTIMENGIDKQDTSFMTSVIISNLNQLEQDYKICSQGTLTMQKCLSERNMDNLQTTFQIAKIMAINCWSILSLFCFVLTPSIIFFIYKRRELLEEDKVLDEKEVMVDVQRLPILAAKCLSRGTISSILAKVNIEFGERYKCRQSQFQESIILKEVPDHLMEQHPIDIIYFLEWKRG
ncbi:hypothetical protein G210_0038 [Candida maltosa Xu316]|uniref:Uncharacterized protein n=1 Tax=Candida maltosa (strain Xu316) TaxID=1245528 RepID=M3K6N4_CANMX|nr:hypothetical protein G210_0038 [Candida maltosa Xu316]